MIHQPRFKFRFYSVFYIPLFLLYMEVIFHAAVFGVRSFLNLPGIFLILGLGLFLGLVISLFPERPQYILIWIVQILAVFLFCAEIIYYSVFQQFLAPFSMLGVAGQALDFMDVILKNIGLKLAVLLLFLLPLILYGIFGRRKITWHRIDKLEVLPLMAACVLLHGGALLLLHTGSHSLYSNYDIYYHNVSSDMTAEAFGVCAMTRLDGKYALFGAPSKTLAVSSTTPETAAPETSVPEQEEQQIDTSPNILNIDFDEITANAPNGNVVQLTQYFQSQLPSRKNEYTGMFEGYNVIFITAEGFSKYAIDETRTPTLYKLTNEGFVFQHYYTPPWYASTSDGEYANLTGLLPTDGRVSLKETGTRQSNMYFTLGRRLSALGYAANAYHNNSYTYYGRDLSHPNMRYNWHGTGNWFQPETNDAGYELWPQSDVQLIAQSVEDYIHSEPFLTYYMSVSGHMMYEFESNCMSARNKDAVADLPYSDTAKGYLASQLELEKALTLLLQTLEENGLADHTLIVLGADHIPYNDVDVLNELAGHELESEFELYENSLIIWSGSMEAPVTVEKYCYDVDILPTISNLLGIPYDSRLLIGQDILSDSEQLVCFPDRSFISGKCFYNAATGAVTPLGEEEVSNEYIENMSAIVYNKFSVSEMILDEDYYQYLNGSFD
ncbi:LTA synthase family protein [Bariatricus massiliensis]|uniref:LTA synthase family protein n=1 Tax=Bariatricus massiliensis TaxID=1745713 RepID=A0ABS8DHT3_9FIRM|nr:LTA synthase family protein [Bariatricus massiliensis]MCB7304974.1 LTA synthase family protein [Bariatricus massiliensis]MCB7375528.1 LTA synthase family protein [Bariatricus massiliensis]MCB7387988.1 LTA synthase family protein [Bariatricus massiliensis]MCB7412192.1 LTA synthase family protein [Bariatricus massiliensis]